MTGQEVRLSDLLTRALHERVDGRDVPSTPLGDVVGTAHRIRRGRRIRTGVVAAVVVGVLATPFVLDAAGRFDSSPAPADPSPTAPPLHLRLADVALGEPPGVAWIDGSDYVAADGTRTTLPVEAVAHATPYRGGFLVTAYDDNHVVLLDSELREVWRHCTTGGFAVSDDGLRTAYTTVGCKAGAAPVVHLGPTDGEGDEQTVPAPLADGWPVGVIGDAVVVSSFNTPPPALVDFEGASTDLDPLSVVRDVDERSGLASGRVDGVPGLGAVIDTATGTLRWTKQGWEPEAFSPDGSMVAAVSSGGSTGSTGWAIFDTATGDRLHEFATPAGFSSRRVVWEDDEHLLMTMVQDDTQAILRTTLDGAIQRASDAAPYDGEDLRYGLEGNDFP